MTKTRRTARQWHQLISDWQGIVEIDETLFARAFALYFCGEPSDVLAYINVAEV